MTIQTKYEIGQRVWIVYENKGEVCVYDDHIDEICISESGLYYMLKEASIDETEANIVLYENTDKLVEKIKQIMEDIKKKKVSDTNDNKLCI